MKQTTSSPFVYRLTSERVHSTITIGVPTLISLVVPVAASMCLISVPVAFRLCSLQCCACVLCLYCLAQLFIKRMPDWLWVSATDGGFLFAQFFSHCKFVQFKNPSLKSAPCHLHASSAVFSPRPTPLTCMHARFAAAADCRFHHHSNQHSAARSLRHRIHRL